MKITSGEFEVFASGTTISYNNNPILFEIGPNFKVRFTFDTDEKTEQSTISTRLIDPTTIELRLINFSAHLDSGNLEPIYIAEYGGKAYSLNIRVRRIEKSMSRTLDYTWYTKATVVVSDSIQEGGQNGN